MNSKRIPEEVKFHRNAIAVPPESALEPTDSRGCTACMDTPAYVTSACASWPHNCAATQHHSASLCLMGARQHQLPVAAWLLGGQVPHIAGHRRACSHSIDMQRFGSVSAEWQGTPLVATDLAANKCKANRPAQSATRCPHAAPSTSSSAACSWHQAHPRGCRACARSGCARCRCRRSRPPRGTRTHPAMIH